MSEAFEWIKVLLALGKAVYDAVKAGETHKTVGEIFAASKLDMSKIESLESDARKHFGA